MGGFLQDVPYALRGLRRSPGFAAVAILSLGMGFGVNTAVFSLVDSLLLRPLPFPDAERVLLLEGVLAAAPLAAWLPARRATRVDPTVALHAD